MAADCFAGHTSDDACARAAVLQAAEYAGRSALPVRPADFLSTFLGTPRVERNGGFSRNVLIDLAPRPGLEPGTCGLTVYREPPLFQRVRRKSVPQLAQIRRSQSLYWRGPSKLRNGIC